MGFAYCYVAIDIIGHLLRESVFAQNFPVPNLFDYPILTQLWYAWLLAFRTGFDLVIVYYLVAAIAVASGMSIPQQFPPVFGSFRQAYSVRKCWGYCWHQFLRRLFETSSSVVTSVLGIKKGTFLSRYTQLYIAFFVSACIHHIGTLNLPYDPATEGGKLQFAFFMLQAVGE